MKIEQYNYKSLISEEDFIGCYNVLAEALPANEIRSLKGQKKLLELSEYKLYLKREAGGEITAVMAVWEFETLRFIEHLAVSSQLRSKGIGGKLLDFYLTSDSKPVVLEVELPDTELSRRRIEFYKRHGFSLNKYPYEQLPLNPGDIPMPLYIMSYPGQISQNEFEDVKELLYKRVFGKGAGEL